MATFADGLRLFVCTSSTRCAHKIERAYLLLRHYRYWLGGSRTKTTMASSKQEGTSAAAEQLRSMSLGESAERNENNEDAAEENGTTPTKLCSACETKSDALKKCRNCKCVWYCDKDCQNKHWKEHKKECKRIKKILGKRGGKLDIGIGIEKDVGPLGKLPPREEFHLHACVADSRIATRLL